MKAKGFQPYTFTSEHHKALLFCKGGYIYPALNDHKHVIVVLLLDYNNRVACDGSGGGGGGGGGGALGGSPCGGVFGCGTLLAAFRIFAGGSQLG